MRLSRVAWTILIAGIFIIAFVALYMVYAREQRAQEPLEQALSVAQDALPNLTTERTKLENTLTELEDRVDRATLQLETAKASFPTTQTESIEVDERLFDIAGDWGLNVTQLTATEPGDEGIPVEVEVEIEDIEVEDVDFTVTTFTIEVEGAVVDILDFIHSVATHDDFIAATIEVVTLEVPEPLTDEEKEDLTDEEIEEAEMPSAMLTVTLYNYQGE